MVHKKKRQMKHRPSLDMFKVMTLVLGLLLIISILTEGFSEGFMTDSEDESEILFLKPAGCSEICLEAETAVMQAAEKAGFDFESVSYNQASIPGYVAVHKGSALISGYVDGALFHEQLCGFTGNTAVCGLVQAGK